LANFQENLHIQQNQQDAFVFILKWWSLPREGNLPRCYLLFPVSLAALIVFQLRGGEGYAGSFFPALRAVVL
jgi:hypothetical protein